MSHSLLLFAQAGNRFNNGGFNNAPDPATQAAAGGMIFVCMGFYLLLIVVMVASLWKIFTKAGQPGWAAIVPFYNIYVLTCEISKREILWFLLLFVPFVNIVASVLNSIELAKKFGKSDGFGIGLAFLGPIFYPIPRLRGRRVPNEPPLAPRL